MADGKGKEASGGPAGGQTFEKSDKQALRSAEGLLFNLALTT